MTDQINNSSKQAKAAPLGATFTPEARERITTFLQSFVSFEPTLGLLYGALDRDGSGKGSWSITAFDRKTVNALVEMYSGFGSIVQFELDGITVVIPQLAHIDELESGRLDFVGDRISLLTQEES